MRMCCFDSNPRSRKKVYQNASSKVHCPEANVSCML
uniref:Uncharacterized protein n=1 Tax=Anguilla anguilla TaxID=7936 RepID=A0A0E9Q9Y5_ANGAN